MGTWHIYVLSAIITGIFGLEFHQDKYTLFQENITFEYVNSNLIDIAANIYQVSDSVSAMNLTFTLKTVLSDDSKFIIQAFKMINNVYRTSIIQFNKLLKDATEMEMFDLQSLWIQHATPPIVCPLQKGTTYKTVGWSPDSSKFPRTLPGGRYKVFITVTHNNKNLLKGNWFVKVEYKKH